MSTQRVNFTTPVGRIVSGNLYKPNTTDFDGKPLVVKTGPNAGQPRVDFFFALAIPKGAETSWAQTEWGQKIYAVGVAAFPQAAQRPDFAWKIEDGDSTVPNKRNRRPCDAEGWAGHWILKFSGGFAPKVYRRENGAFVQEMQPDFLKPGFYAEVNASVDGNGNQNNPGIYLNHSIVMFSGYGQEITVGPDVNAAGFSTAPSLPAGASTIPLASSVPLPGLPVPAAPTPVTPNPQFLNVPSTPIAPAPAQTVIPAVPTPASPSSVPAVPVPAKNMTALAGATSYEAFKQGGWTDDLLIQNGYMTA